MNWYYLPLVVFSLLAFSLKAQDKSDWTGNFPDACTSITVGKLASADGSVMTSHTDDSHRTRSWMNIESSKEHEKKATVPMYARTATDSFVMPSYLHTEIGRIPQVEETHGYINTAYPCMNDKQLAIGESTFGGRDVLQSDEGLIDCQRLCQLMLERCETARGAIEMAGKLLAKYGWRDYGECLTIADTKEVWHFEVVGPGTENVGAIWAAQRVPDNHISVNANASRIMEVDLDNPDYFMASKNLKKMAKDSAWWNPEKEIFRFAYAYAPRSRQSVATRRREWRVFDMLAPSLNLSPTAENYPFSIKPDAPVKLIDMMSVFRDYYEGTPYDMRRNITTTDEDGKEIISPLANPFMPYDELDIMDVGGSWFHTTEDGDIRFLGERTIARWYTMYGTITQSRDWMPDDVGGVVWLAQDNIATSIYVPVYCGVEHLPASYRTKGRKEGYTMQSAWWAFNRMSTLAAQRWGDMKEDVFAVTYPFQDSLLDKQKTIEGLALQMKSDRKRRDFLTRYTNEAAGKAVQEAIDLGDYLWTKYDEKF